MNGDDKKDINNYKNNDVFIEFSERKNSYLRKIKYLLVLLYTIQGLIMSFILGSILSILRKNNFTYNEISLIELSGMPFSVKLLWAPIVDNYYFEKIGKRKTWLYSMQILIAFTCIFIGINYENLILEDRIFYLTLLFTFLHFLIASQDVALDGWALTLCLDNSSLAAYTQTVGQIIGHIMGGTIFILFNSKDFCNKYFNIENEILTISSFFNFISIYCLILTIFLYLYSENENEIFIKKAKAELKMSEKEEKKVLVDVDVNKEKDSHLNSESEKNSVELELSLKDSYSILWKFLKNGTILFFCVLLIISKIGDSYFNNVSTFYIDQGFSLETLQMLSSCMIPISLISTYLVQNYKDNFFQRYYKIYLYLLVSQILDICLIYFYEDIQSIYYGYILTFLIFLISSLKTSCSMMMFLCRSSFFNKIADKRLGGTYITFFASVHNFSNQFSSFICLNLIGIFGHKLIAVFAFIYSLFFFVFMSKHLIDIEENKSDKFKIS